MIDTKERCWDCGLPYSKTNPASLMQGKCEPCRQAMYSYATDEKLHREKQRRMRRELLFILGRSLRRLFRRSLLLFCRKALR